MNIVTGCWKRMSAGFLLKKKIKRHIMSTWKIIFMILYLTQKSLLMRGRRSYIVQLQTWLKISTMIPVPAM